VTTSCRSPLREARALGSSGRRAEALLCYRRVLVEEPDNAESVHFLGVLISEVECDHRRAFLWVERSLRLVTQSPHFLTNAAIILQRLQRLDDALDYLTEALRVDGKFILAILNAGHVHRKKKSYMLAVACYEKVVSLLPSDLAAYEHLSLCYSYPEDLNLRCRALQRAREIDPDNVDVGFSLGIYYLMSGRFAEGWDLFENRWRTSHVRENPRYSKPLSLQRPTFDSQNPDGPVFVWSEQGVGDEIMFASLIPEFVDRFKVEVILQVDPRLEGILRRSLPGITVVPRGIVPAEVSYATHLPSGDLPRLLRRSVESFVLGQDRFLVADPARVQALRSALSGLVRPIVGISWYSSNGETRCVPLRDLGRVLRRFDLSVVNLQYGDHVREISSIDKDLGRSLFDFADIDCQNDLEGLLALIECCDLVVSIGNATVHFSGASGVSTLALLPHLPGWRWLSHGDQSLWYRSVKLLRQVQAGSWDSPLQSVEAELERCMRRI